MYHAQKIIFGLIEDCRSKKLERQEDIMRQKRYQAFSLISFEDKVFSKWKGNIKNVYN